MDELRSGSAEAGSRPGLVRIVATVAFGLLLVAPMLAAVVADRSHAVMPLQFGALAGAVGALAGSRASVIAVAFGGAAVFAAGLVGTSPVAAVAVFGTLGAAVGWSALDGLSRTINIGAIAAGFVVSPTVDVGDAVVDTVLFVGAAVWAIGALSLLVRRGILRVRVPVGYLPRRSALAYATALGLAAAVVNGLVVGLDVQRGAWANLTLFIVALPSRHDLYRRALERTTGTVVGGAAAVLLARVFPWPDLWSAMALLAIVPALGELTKRYWVYSAYLTVVVVFSSSDSTSSLVEAHRDRVVLTAVTAGALVVIAWVANTVWTRTHASDDRSTLA